MKQRGWSFSKTALIMVFMMQGPLLWIVSVPAQAGILSDTGGPLGALGVPLTTERSMAIDPRAVPLGARVSAATQSTQDQGPQLEG